MWPYVFVLPSYLMSTFIAAKGTSSAFENCTEEAAGAPLIFPFQVTSKISRNPQLKLFGGKLLQPAEPVNKITVCIDTKW